MEVCFFFPVPYCIQEIPHRPLCSAGVSAPGPEAWCSRLVPSQARVAVAVGPVGASCDGVPSFLKEKGNQRIQLSSCSLEIPFFCSYLSRKAQVKERGSKMYLVGFRNYSSHHTLGLLLPPLCHLHPSICCLRSQAGEFVGE